MTDFDQTIFNNPQLGQVNTCDFLDEVQAQVQENHHARREGRESRKILPRERFGNYRGLPDNGPLKFEDGTPVYPQETMNDYWQDWEASRVASGYASFDPDHMELPDGVE